MRTFLVIWLMCIFSLISKHWQVWLEEETINAAVWLMMFALILAIVQDIKEIFKR